MSPLAVLPTWWMPIVCRLVSELHVRCLVQAGLHLNCVPASSTSGTLMNTISVNVTKRKSIALQMRVYIMIFHIHVSTQRISVNIPMTSRLMILFGAVETGMSLGGAQGERVPPDNEYCADIPCTSNFGYSLLFIDSIDFGAFKSKRCAQSEVVR